MSSARVMPAVWVPSSHAGFQGVPPACHSDIHVCLAVGWGVRAGEPYSWPLWSKNGSWQGHNIPWANTTTAATNKYWAAGGRCAR